MPTSGTANYAGQFGATATTSNWVDVPTLLATGKTAPTSAQTVSANNSWQINGNSALSANFGTGVFTGTLTPRNWIGLNSNSGLTNININSALTNGGACFNQTAACNGSTAQSLANFNSWSNYQGYMSTVVNLNGQIRTNTTNAAKPNQVVGTATLDPNAGWITSSGTNPMYAGFFGTVTAGKPQEVTGTFAVDGTATDPNGGIVPMTDERRAYLSMSGIFNGQ